MSRLFILTASGIIFLMNAPCFSQGIKLSVPATSLNTAAEKRGFIKSNELSLFPVHQSCKALPGINDGIHYTAFFCRMESKVHNKLNVWIKLRAGNDEEYRKLIK